MQVNSARASLLRLCLTEDSLVTQPCILVLPTTVSCRNTLSGVLAGLLGLFLFQTQSAASTTLNIAELLPEARGHHDWLVAIRRHLHRWPEILFQVEHPLVSGGPVL